MDDHKLIRECIKALLEPESRIEVVGEAANGLELVQLIPGLPADMILMDINMPLMDGLKATEYLQAHFPLIKVIMLSSYEELNYVIQSFQAGACGYLTKKTGIEQLRCAIQCVAAGKPFLDTQISLKILQKQTALQLRKSKLVIQSRLVIHNLSGLTEFELEVLKLLAAGFTNAEIAHKLMNSTRTIETWRKKLMKKTGAKNTAALIKYALAHHLIS